MKKGLVNEEMFEKVVNALCEEGLYEGMPSLLTNEVDEVTKKIKDRTSDNRTNFTVLIKDRIDNDLVPFILSFDENQPIDEECQDYLTELYLHHDMYEESVNKIVEQLEGGLFSYDKTYHVLNAYEKELRSGKSETESYCKVPLKQWVSYCKSLANLSKYGEAEAFIDARDAVIKIGLEEEFTPVLSFDDAKVGDVLFNREEEISIVVEEKTEQTITLMKLNSSGMCSEHTYSETSFYKELKEIQSLGEYKVIDVQKGLLL